MDTTEGGCFEKYSKDNGGVFNAAEHESIEDSMYYYDINSSGQSIRPNLIVTLRDLGYDVIILNIPTYKTTKDTDPAGTPDYCKIDGGADYIERNGLALASYLKSTKLILNQNGSNEGIVVMGPSMGGLISRYALAYMEKQFAATGDVTWKHNTRLWVSFDSPHLGANIPVGAQANIWFFGEKLHKEDAKLKYYNVLNSIAGKQMLLNQFSNTLATLSNGYGTSSNAPFRTQFQNNLNSNGVAGSGGFPVSVPGSFRKIAIVNGSLNGTKNGSEGGEFLNVRGYKDPNILEGALAGAAFGSYFGWAGIGIGAVAGGLLGASNANITVLRCKDNFYPAYNQAGYLFQGDGQNFDISNGDFSHPSYKLTGINNDYRGSFDVVPGGTYQTGKTIRDEIVKGLEQFKLSSEIRGTNIDGHAFIPTFSSLAHFNPYQDWSNPLNTNLVCPTNKLTPFDSYFGTSLNTPHVSLTKEMVDWLLKELNNKPQSPWFPIQPDALTGPAIICANIQTTYSINDICKVPSPVKYTDENGVAINGWSVQGNLQIVSSTPYSLTVQGTSNDPNDATITATFQNGQTASIPVHVGAPSTPFVTINNSWDWVSINSGTFQMSVPSVPSATSYYWTVDADISEFPLLCPTINQHHATFTGGIITTQPIPEPTVAINWGNCLGTYILTCYAVNDCGASPYSVKITTVGKPQNNPCKHQSFKINIAPNPVESGRTNFVVSKLQDATPCNYPIIEGGYQPKNYVNYSQSSAVVKIYDFSGNQVFANEYPTPEYVEVKELPKEDATNPDEVRKYEELNYYHIQDLILQPGFYFIKIIDSDDNSSDGVTTQIEVK